MKDFIDQVFDDIHLAELRIKYASFVGQFDREFNRQFKSSFYMRNNRDNFITSVLDLLPRFTSFEDPGIK
jgi:hypothetical protein